MAPVAAPAPAVAAARVVRLAVVPVAAAAAVLASRGGAAAAADAVAVQPGEDGGEEEEDGVHDAEGEARLEQGARLVGVDADAVAVDAEEAEVDGVGRAVGDVGAVGAGDEAEVVDAGDEGADEACGGREEEERLAAWIVSANCEGWERETERRRAHTQINKRDESRIGAAPVVGEEGEDGPGEGQDRYYEEYQDVVRSQRVGVDVAVDEVAQHADDGREGDDLHEPPKDEAYGEEDSHLGWG